LTADGGKLERKVGLWIDHRKAVIVSIVGDQEEIKSITSDIEKHVRFSGEAQENTEEDIRDRRFTKHLNKYYDEVISFVKDADSILIFGPGEAKGEFIKRLASETQIGRVVFLETADKMTEPQIVAKVREHFST
jgi:stalled ribosome rescue protein Dom34